MAKRAKPVVELVESPPPSPEVQAEIGRYMKMPYSRELIPDEGGTYFARIVELPGCMTQGDNLQHALEMLDEAMSLWLEGAIEDGLPIPEPFDWSDYSGRFLTRVPPTLHRDLVRRADREHVSLNMFVVAALARALGQQ
jgi:antitoxin HicB